MKRLIIILIILLLPGYAAAEVLTSDAVWSGEVVMAEDIVVPAGVTLTIRPGTVVQVLPADSTKIDPEYMSHRSEITVRGTLRIQGKVDAPVVFAMQEQNYLEQWAGIIIDSGRVELDWSSITGAETGMTVLQGEVTANHLTVSGNRYGMIIHDAESQVTLNDSRIEDNDYGLFLFRSAKLSSENTVILNNHKNDIYTAEEDQLTLVKGGFEAAGEITGQVYRDEALLGVTIWQGRVLVDGLVRLPPEAHLLIMPGTVIEFTKRDTNNDTMGENGLMIQGRFIAKGTKEKPIIFRSAEKNRARGDWDAINILGSDQVQNLIEFCQIEDAFRGLHFHYANVAVTNSVLRNSYRGAQFQESLVTMRYNSFYDNKSGVQARDSEVVFEHNQVFDNQNGANFFRLDLTARHNLFANNNQDGLRIREGVSLVTKNQMIGNRFGLLVADSTYGEFRENIVVGNHEGGLGMRNTDHTLVSGNVISNNGINGINIRESRGTIRNNIISGNRERGIAVISYSGTVAGNNIFANGLYGIGLEGSSDIQAATNWWGESDLAKEIYDSHDEAGLGKVHYEPVSEKPLVFIWPARQLLSDLTWGGLIQVADRITVTPDATLEILPSTTVMFDRAAGLEILGRIVARGLPDKRISFTSTAGQGPMDWDEVSLQQAGESEFMHSDFSYATWGIHSHFTSLSITGCRFSNNDGGIRFRSGPLQISNSLFTDNRIGIRAYRGVGQILKNEITGNEIGIFVREKGSGLAIHNNNIYGNERYSLRLGDFNRQDVDASRNWWGGGDPALTIFDKNQESYIGSVIFEPVLTERVDIIVQ